MTKDQCSEMKELTLDWDTTYNRGKETGSV